jgi:ABC-type bacteriocin/lantibiotic exporter with double-glycine peptidase domain
VNFFRTAFIVLALVGCAGAPARVATPETGRLLDVPFYADNTDQCGPSALAGVLSFWGDSSGPAPLKGEVYLSSQKGSLAMDLLLAAKRRGFEASLYRGSFEDLKENLLRGRPLIAYINRGFREFPIGHFVVVTGFDNERKGLYVHSGTKEDRFVSYKSFARGWDKAQRSTLLVLPPQEAAHARP